MKVFWIVLITITVTAILFALLLFLYGYLVFKKAALRSKKPPRSRFAAFAEYRKQTLDYLGSLPVEPITLRAKDGVELKCEWFANPRNVGAVIFVHGYGSGGRREAFAARFWYERGYNLFVADNRAHGESGGKYVGFGILEADDLLLRAEFVEKQKAQSNIFIVGVSMGAATVMSAASMLPSSVRGIIADCGYTSAAEQLEYVLRGGFIAKLGVRAANFWFKKKAKYSLYDRAPVEELAKTTIPALFIHGDADRYVPPQMSERNYAVCASRKKLVMISGAKHAAAHFTDSVAYERALSEFISENEIKQD